VPAPLSSHMLLIVLHSPFDTDSFALQRVSGTMRAKSFTKRRYHKGTARYCLSSRTVEGGSSWAMAATLSGSVPIPWPITRCSRYSSSCFKNWHFTGFIHRFTFFGRQLLGPSHVEMLQMPSAIQTTVPSTETAPFPGTVNAVNLLLVSSRRIASTHPLSPGF